MKAAFFLWKRRLLWVILLSVLLAAAMGAYAYLRMPVRYEAVAEVLMLRPDGESLSALADEAIRWSAYDALKAASLSGVEWADVETGVQRYGNTSILLVKARGGDAGAAAAAANALAEALVGVVNDSMNETALKPVVVAGTPQEPMLFDREWRIAAVFLGAFVFFSLILLLICVKRPLLIRSADIADAAEVPTLAELPDLKGAVTAFERFDAKERPMLYDFAGYYAHEQLKLISLAMRHRAKQDKQDKLRSLAVVSRSDGEYRSEVAVLLAQELSRQGSRVLLIDMNWMQPRLGQLLQAKGERDLIHCLASNIPVDQAIIHTRTRNLFFMDQNHSQSMAAQLSASVSFSAFLESAYGKFDFLLFDMPQAGPFTDALAISGVLHGYLPVVRAGRWLPAQIGQWIRPMHALGRSALGLVITDAASKQARRHRKPDKPMGI